MSLFNPQQIIINFLKGLGINEELIVGKMNEFIAIANSYRQEVASVNRRIGVMEQNISLIMAHLEIEEIDGKAVDNIKLVNKM